MSALAVAALVAAGCGDDGEGGGSSGFDLRLGVVIPLTGDLSAYGPPHSKSVDLAIGQVEAALKEEGVDNVKIEKDVADDQNTQEGAVQAARKAVQGDAGCVLGALASASTIAIANGATVPGRVPQISPASSTPELTNLEDDGYVFRVQPSDALQAPVLAQVMKEKLGPDATVSLAGRNDAAGTGILKEVKAALDREGVKNQGPVLYDPTASSYNSEAAEITKGDPDGYFVMDYPNTFTKVGPALLRTGKFTGKQLFVAGAWPPEAPEDIPAEALEGTTATQPSPQEGNEAGRAFDELYESSKGTKARVTNEPQMFDAAMICMLAAIAADSGEGRDIVEHIQQVSSPGGNRYTFEQLPDAIRDLRDGKDIDYEGVSGTTNLDDNGDMVSGYYNVGEYVDGKQVFRRQIESDG
jgi:ABC-type branched-subunit amino acid transport system substrate-binding protein